MKIAITTRFRCSCPLTNFNKFTLMFLTLIPQYLNELVESKIGDFTSPQAFHAVKVQSFKHNPIKLLTEFAGELPLKVFALIADFPIKPCDLSDTPPPAVRTFLFTAQCLIETPKFLQVRFQGLWVLFLLTRAERQICVFHAEVCPNTLTRCWQRFRFYKICYDIQPIVPTSVALDREKPDIPFKLTVLVKCISHFIMSPFTLFPLSKIESEAIVVKRPAHLFQREGFELVAFLDFRSATKFLEKTDIRLINAPQLLLDRLAWQCFPMRVRRLFQIRQVGTHSSMVRIRQCVLISLTLPLMEILVDLPHIIKQVAKPNTIRLIIKRIFKGFHGLSSIKSLTPS